MSDYFRALIRSSGIRVGDERPAAGSVGPDADVLEIGREREAAVTGAAAAPQPVAGRRASSAGTMGSPPVPSAPTPHDPEWRVPAAPAPAAARPGRVGRSDAAAAPSPVLADPVRLAVQWVAADPESPPLDGAVPLRTGGRPSRASLTAASPSPPPPRGPDDVVDIHEQVPHLASDEVGSGRRAETPGIRAIPAAVPPPLEAEPSHPTAARSQEAFEETAVISIGAITVHVEGSEPQTVLQVPAPQPPPPPARRAERSGLARRYLRSF